MAEGTARLHLCIVQGLTIKEDIDMSTTQPIRDKKLLKMFKNYYRETKPNIRNYTLIIVGLNTALRINDILNLTYDMVYTNNKVKEHIIVRERKTGKKNCIFLNAEVRLALLNYRNTLIETDMYKNGNPYLFPSPKKNNQPLSRFQAYRIICTAAEILELDETISCHSLRKTFGYHAWKQGKDPVVIMTIFNHSSFNITKRYLCIEQDDKDKIFRDVVI